MTIRVAAYSDKGGRANNEDSYAYLLKPPVGCFVVADGLGGHAMGEVASKFVCEYIVRQGVEGDASTDASILKILNAANLALLEEQQKSKAQHGMKTTVVAAFTSGKQLKCIHFGDSRFYYFKNKKLVFRSRDHSMSQVAVDLGEITDGEIRFHEDRNRVLRVLGDNENLNTKTPIFMADLESGDAFLLCTDGFWEPVCEEEMGAGLNASDTPDIWLDTMLINLKTKGTSSSDNYTAICCYVDSEG